MSDDNKNDDDFGALTGGDDSDSGDSGFGNLPPLSDFDSGDAESDSGLPPLDSDPDDGGSDGGLPPIVDIRVDTPAVRPSDLDTPEHPQEKLETPGGGFDTPTNDLDTPDPGGLGFQDFAADSDFSPETPEIGPGPDSDIETPMFDSAFGGDSDDFSSGGAGTPSPTQAMETPMFDSGDDSGFGASNFGDDTSTPAPGGDMGFDNDAFGAPTPDVGADGATPIPDFSPDTGMPQEMGAVPAQKKAKGGGGGGMGIVKVAMVAILTLVIGAAVGAFMGPRLGFVPNPEKTRADDLQTKVTGLESDVRKLEAEITGGATNITKEELERMRAEYEQLTTNIATAEAKLNSTQSTLTTDERRLNDILEEVDIAEDEFTIAAEQLEEIQSEITISQARHDGLKAESDRLTDAVGELEEANERRQATLDTLLHNIDLLTVQVKGGSPLTPERYNHDARVAKVERLHDKVARAKWVTPQLLNEYTDLYLAELGVASAREYFFAKIPLHDSLGNKQFRWAECLMNGNWSVYFRTLDGSHVGVYENVAVSGAPEYKFREDVPAAVQSEVSQAITAARVEGYEDKILVLQGKVAITETETPIQKKFSSLLR